MMETTDRAESFKAPGDHLEAPRRRPFGSTPLSVGDHLDAPRWWPFGCTIGLQVFRLAPPAQLLRHPMHHDPPGRGEANREILRLSRHEIFQLRQSPVLCLNTGLCLGSSEGLAVWTVFGCACILGVVLGLCLDFL